MNDPVTGLQVLWLTVVVTVGFGTVGTLLAFILHKLDE